FHGQAPYDSDPLSLHDALPISVANPVPIEVKGDWLVCTNEICVPESATLTLRLGQGMGGDPRFDQWQAAVPPLLDSPARFELTRSEEHTSELQSRENLVCRLLL